MSKVIKVILHNRFPECQDDLCPWTRTCTQHRSAGDFRMESGMVPTWAGLDPHVGEAVCVTAGLSSDELQPIGEAFTIDDVSTQMSLFRS